MSASFKAISLSYKTAPVEIREQISLNDQAIHRLLLRLKEVFGVTDALVLSTCNRTEVYYSHELDLSHELLPLIVLESGGNLEKDG